MVHGDGPSIGFLMTLVKFREVLLTALPVVHDHHAPGLGPGQLHPGSQGPGGGDTLRVETGEHGQLVTVQQYSTVQYSTVQYSAVQYNTVH